ncbi:MAG: hypothetical protein GX220_07915 [Treponema sp.]|nr:hypothetical protein [Treponema sp.]
MKIIRIIFCFFIILFYFSCATNSKNLISVSPDEPKEEIDTISDFLSKTENDFFPEKTNNVDDNPDEIFEPEITFSSEQIKKDFFPSVPKEPAYEKSEEYFSTDVINTEKSIGKKTNQEENVTIEIVEPKISTENESQNSSSVFSGKKTTVVRKTDRTNSSAIKLQDQKASVSVQNEKNQNTLISAEPTVQILSSLGSDTQKTENLNSDDLLIKAQKAYLQKEYPEALKFLDSFFLNSVNRLDEAWFLQGEIYEVFDGLGNIEKAKNAYQTLINGFPQSKLWQKAKERVIYINRFYFNVW